jgi:hypothetical protein
MVTSQFLFVKHYKQDAILHADIALSHRPTSNVITTLTNLHYFKQIIYKETSS